MKTSTIKTWIIRILLAVTILMAIGLLMLSLLGGTSDSHRRGLEQAFSDFMNADVRIGRLEQFNVMPQLVFKTNDVHGVFRDSQNEFLADRLEIAFGFTDLAMGRRRIENFQLNNFRFSSESKTDLRIDYAGIEDGAQALFATRGQFEKKNFNLSFPLEKTVTGRPGYALLPAYAVDGMFGTLAIKAHVVEGKEKLSKNLKDIEVSSKGRVVMTGGTAPETNQITLDCLPALKVADAETKSDVAALKNISFLDFSESCNP